MSLSLLPEQGVCVVHDALIGVIVGVGKEDIPVFGQGVGVDGEPVVLTGDKAAIGSLVDARLVVATVTVPERQKSTCRFDNELLKQQYLTYLVLSTFATSCARKDLNLKRFLWDIIWESSCIILGFNGDNHWFNA